MDHAIETQNLIEISDTALQEFSRLNVGKEEFLRIALVEGGCSGLSYQLTAERVKTPFDTVLFANEALLVVTDKNSSEYLAGLYIDYSNDLIDVGFKFKNPNAVQTCGCGNSMSV